MYNNVLINTNNLPITILLIAVGCLVLITLVCFIFTYVVFRKTFTRTEKIATDYNPIYAPYKDLMKQGANYFLGLNPEEVSLQSHDNLKLCGYFYETPNARGTVLFMHGYHGDPLNDFGPVLKHFIDIGFSVLLVFQRAHGKSQGKYITFGVKESNDCLLWAKYLAERFPGHPIGLHGVSMGGATVGMVSCDENLPDEVKVIANDCGFTSPDAIISSVRKLMKLPFFPFQLIVRFYAKAFAKFSLTEKDASESYAKSKIPALFIHGELDDFVPYQMGVENYNKSNASDKLMISVKGAGHGLAYITEPERVTREFTEFYNRHIPF